MPTVYYDTCSPGLELPSVLLVLLLAALLGLVLRYEKRRGVRFGGIAFLGLCLALLVANLVSARWEALELCDDLRAGGGRRLAGIAGYVGEGKARRLTVGDEVLSRPRSLRPAKLWGYWDNDGPFARRGCVEVVVRNTSILRVVELGPEGCAAR